MPKSRTKSSAPSPGKLRIIGGAWRRHQLPIAPVEGLRPTPDRVRETLFNWLGQDCRGYEVLDLFSGTGALGLEAASRGAAQVTFIENNVQVAKQLRANCAHLLNKWQPDWGNSPRLTLHQADGVTKLDQLNGRFDVIFLDPPFGSDLLRPTLGRLKRLLQPAGLIYIEWGESLFNDLPGLAHALQVSEIDALRHIHAGQVHAHLVGLPSV